MLNFFLLQLDLQKSTFIRHSFNPYWSHFNWWEHKLSRFYSWSSSRDILFKCRRNITSNKWWRSFFRPILIVIVLFSNFRDVFLLVRDWIESFSLNNRRFWIIVNMTLVMTLPSILRTDFYRLLWFWWIDWLIKCFVYFKIFSLSREFSSDDFTWVLWFIYIHGLWE